jgi:Lon protease-like protein
MHEGYTHSCLHQKNRRDADGLALSRATLLGLSVVSIEPITRSALERLPVFPLPATVQFPGTVLPLHIFEPRYVQMVRDAMAGDRALAIVMLKDDDGAMEAQAEIFDVACAGVIVHAEAVGSDRFNILVHGVHRVRLLDELPLHEGYRRFRTQTIPPPTKTAIEQAGHELARLQSCVLSLRESVAHTDEASWRSCAPPRIRWNWLTSWRRSWSATRSPASVCSLRPIWRPASASSSTA